MQVSMTRLLLLIKKQWSENSKLYLLGLPAMAALMAVLFFFAAPAVPSGLVEDSQRVYFFTWMIGLNSLFTHTLLGDFSKKVNTVNLLSFPVSAAERVLVAVFYGLALFPVIYLLVTWPILNYAHYVDTVVKGNLNELIDIFYGKSKMFYLVNLLLQSFIIACAAVFKRFVAVKTVLLACLIVVGTVLLNKQIAALVFGDKQPEHLSRMSEDKKSAAGGGKLLLRNADPYTGADFGVGQRDYTVFEVRLSKAANDFSLLAFCLLMPPFFLVIAVLRLKEKQLS